MLAIPITPDSRKCPAEIEDGRERVNFYASRSRAEGTRRAYDRDFRRFAAWCDDHSARALPAEAATVAIYLAHMSDDGRAVATITRALAAISIAHKRAGHPTPTSSDGIAETLRGIRRARGVAPKKKAPLVVEDLRRVVATLGDGKADVRDRALLVLGFAGAFRRSELVALDVDDIAFVRAGVEVTLRRSKTDQEGRGTLVAIPFGSALATCPVRALKRWLEVATITDGPVFRAVDQVGRISNRRLCDRAVALIVQKRALAAGLEADVAGHSLRAGFATTAANAGVSLVDSMRQTRHSSMDVARGYVRRATAWEANAAERVGL